MSDSFTPAVQRQEPSGRKGLGGPKDKVTSGQGYLDWVECVSVGGLSLSPLVSDVSRCCGRFLWVSVFVGGD